MKNIIETMSAQRRKMLAGLAVGFGAWQGMRTFDTFMHDHTLPRFIRIPVLIIGLAGWLFWSFYLIRLFLFNRKCRLNPHIGLTLNDEYVQQCRSRAFNIAFWILLPVQGLFLGLNLWIGLEPASVINMNMLIGVLSAIIAFLILDREP